MATPGTLPRRLIRSESGLTLVEIIVVLIILGLVMTFVGGKIFTAGEGAKVKLTSLKMKEVSSNIHTYQLQNNQLPPTLTAITTCGPDSSEGCITLATADTLKDAWGNAFQYNLENDGRSFRLKSFGADGREGGSGTDGDIVQTGP